MSATRQAPQEPPASPITTPRRASRRRATRIKKYVGSLTCAAIVIGAIVVVAVVRPWTPGRSVHSTQPVRYVGVYEPDAPHSYAGVDQFAQAIGRQPNLVSYYSPWLEPFQVGFAISAAHHGAVTLVQIDPKNVPLSSITAGRYDACLQLRTAVKNYAPR